ncbi:MAG: DUF6444 domain-containing protein [Cyanobacteria bacterium]|nr:DUF6444 domain-containing protein [Cyanobacteriota bacterium]
MTLDEAIEKILALEQENQLLCERLAELKRRLSLDNRNRSKPPSSNRLKKAPAAPKAYGPPAIATVAASLAIKLRDRTAH